MTGDDARNELGLVWLKRMRAHFVHDLYGSMDVNEPGWTFCTPWEEPTSRALDMVNERIAGLYSSMDWIHLYRAIRNKEKIPCPIA